MNKIIIITLSLLVLTGAILAALPAPALAQTPPSGAATFKNPLNDISIKAIVGNVIKWLLGLAALIALLSLIIGGIRLILGGFDNEKEAQRAKRIILWAVIGLVVVILSWLIIEIVVTNILGIKLSG